MHSVELVLAWFHSANTTTEKESRAEVIKTHRLWFQLVQRRLEHPIQLGGLSPDISCGPTSFVGLGVKIHYVSGRINDWRADNSDSVWDISAVSVYRLEWRIEGSRLDQISSQAVDDSDDVLVGNRDDLLVRGTR